MRTVWAFFVLAISLLGQDPALERARQTNLERAAAMPNFVADEISRRYAGRVGSPKWKYEDTVESEITVKGILVSRQNWRRNGKPWKPDWGVPTTGFGAALRPLFDPRCPTTLEFAGHEELRRKPVLAYRFRSPADGCFGNLYGPWPYNAARTGRVLIADPSGDVLQFEEEAAELPQGFRFVRRNQAMTWDSVKIGDAAHWLPVAAEFIWAQRNGALYRVVIEYRNHRHFEAASNVTFK